MQRALAAARGSVEWGWTLLLVGYVVALVAWPVLEIADALPEDYESLLLDVVLAVAGWLLLVHLGVKVVWRLVRRRATSVAS